MNGINTLNVPITTGRPFSDNTVVGKTQIGTGQTFNDYLNQSITLKQSQTLTFSKHAQTRTEQRGITLSQTDMHRLDTAVGKARDKGLTDTLVLMDNTAFIVNVPSKVIVTVVDSTDTKENVFTNIDGAVIV